MGDREARIEAMPAHQRPSPRELGRRSEAADHPFKAMKPDEIGGRGRGVRRVAAIKAPQAPLVTATLDRQKMVIAASNSAALALGLTPGMALTHARALVADLDVRDADPQADRRLLDRLALFAVRRWTPTAMIDGDNGVLLDITGAAHLHGGEAEMARRIVRFCARIGLYARIAVAGTIGAAHAMARHGRDRVAIVDLHGEADAIAPLAVSALRLDPHQCDAARRLGIDHIGDLLAMPRGPLAKRLGASLLERLDQAIGRAREPFDALVPYEVPQAQLRFAEPIASADAIATVIVDLARALVDGLRTRGLGARVVRLACDRVDGVPQLITVGMARGTRDITHLVRLLAMKIESIDPGFGIDAMRLIALRTEPLGAEAIEGDLGGCMPDMALLVDQIVTRLGAQAVYRPSAIESDVPERSVVRIGPMDQAVPWPTIWPRPVRVLRRPERVDGVIALLPDQPPKRFVWRGTTHVVVRADGPERITGEWWKRTSEAYSVRDYYRVEDERGERFWLFRRGDGEHPNTGDLSWHMAGQFG